jgi:hypothetical protein
VQRRRGDAQRERRDVRRNQVLDRGVACLQRRLHRSAQRHRLVRRQRPQRELAEGLRREPPDAGHARGASHEQHLVDALGGDLRVPQRAVDGAPYPIEQGGPRTFRLRTRDRRLERDHAASFDGQVDERDGRLVPFRQSLLGCLRSLPHARPSDGVLLRIDTVLLADAVAEEQGDAFVEVLAPEACIAGRGLDLDDALDDLQHRHVEGAAPEVEHHAPKLPVPLVEAVGEGRGRGLVDDPLDLQAGDGCRIPRRLALQVAEVRRDGHDRLVDGPAQHGLGVALEGREHQRGRLRRGEGAPREVHGPGRPHVTLEGQCRPTRMGRRPRPRGRTHEHRPVLAHGHGARCQGLAQRIGQDRGRAALHERHQGVRRPQVDADDGLARRTLPVARLHAARTSPPTRSQWIRRADGALSAGTRSLACSRALLQSDEARSFDRRRAPSARCVSPASTASCFKLSVLARSLSIRAEKSAAWSISVEGGAAPGELLKSELAPRNAITVRATAHHGRKLRVCRGGGESS